MNALICAALLLTTTTYTLTGAIRLSGTVTDNNSTGIEGATVNLYTRDSLGTVTDASGYFELTESTFAAAIQDARTIPGISPTQGSGIPLQSIVSVHDIHGRLLWQKAPGLSRSPAGRVSVLRAAVAPGVYLITACTIDGSETRFPYIHRGHGLSVHNLHRTHAVGARRADRSGNIQSSDFRDILVVSADGKQTVRREVVSSEEVDIAIKLMSAGVNFITPGIPVYTDKGGTGDVTTYGSVSDPEYSQGGACNYGSTHIRYYAAINVNQVPGDALGQWRDGRCCGKCARVRIKTAEGEVRTTVVRIVDKCPDDDCGIDLGGAPAGEIMGDQPGRYSGEWEWVDCNEFDGVSDGPASIHTKEGTNEWWSLVQVRNGAGGVANIRIRKTDSDTWTSLDWATEAENFFSVPERMLQDEEAWELEVIWDTGSRGSIVFPGRSLAVEDTSYQLIVSP